MGILEKFFGGGKKYPLLKDDSPAAKDLQAVKTSLEALSKDVSDTMEVVPMENSAYVFIGKPPKNFGMAWIEEGKIHNFKTLSEEEGVAQTELLRMVDQLKEAYCRSLDSKRFSASIGGKSVVVTPSRALAREVKEILAHA